MKDILEGLKLDVKMRIYLHLFGLKNNGCELRNGLSNGEVYIKEFNTVVSALFEAQDRIEAYLNMKVLFVYDDNTFPLNKGIVRK